MKYKVGDKVRVRSDLQIDKTYSMEDSDKRDSVVMDMYNYRGRIVTIKDYSNGKYLIEETNWHWTDGMFEGLVNCTKFHVYDTVKHEIYGLGTVIKIGSLIDVDFDEKPFDRPTLKNNVLHCPKSSLTIIQAYTGGEDQ